MNSISNGALIELKRTFGSHDSQCVANEHESCTTLGITRDQIAREAMNEYFACESRERDNVLGKMDKLKDIILCAIMKATSYKWE